MPSAGTTYLVSYTLLVINWSITHDLVTALLWTIIHFPFIMAYVLAGAALSRLVLATDCHDANVDDLTEAYIGKSESELSSGLRWFYCTGLGIALLCMSTPLASLHCAPLVTSGIDVKIGIISLCHVHKEFDGQRIGKQYRLSVRICVAIVLIFLPLADSLSSLQLVSITTGLVVLTLMIDVYGSTSIHDEFWRCTSQCQYRANCPIKRKLAMDAVKTGTTIRLEEVRVEDGGEKAYYDVCFRESQTLLSICSLLCSKFDGSYVRNHSSRHGGRN